MRVGMNVAQRACFMMGTVNGRHMDLRVWRTKKFLVIVGVGLTACLLLLWLLSEFHEKIVEVWRQGLDSIKPF